MQTWRTPASFGSCICQGDNSSRGRSAWEPTRRVMRGPRWQSCGTQLFLESRSILFPKIFSILCMCAIVPSEENTQGMRKSQSNGRTRRDRRTVQQGTLHSTGSMSRFEAERICIEALLAKLGPSSAAIPCAGRGRARMSFAEFGVTVGRLVGILEEAISRQWLTPGDVEALMYTLGDVSRDSRLNERDARAKADAQRMAWAALEAREETHACKLANYALGVDPDCVDALVGLAFLNTHTLGDAIECLELAVAVGERSLGEAFINGQKGHFWLHLETRPYMRAWQSLGDAFFCANRSLDAVRIFEKMLDLNPRDDQAVRYPLVGLYLEIDNLHRAAELLDEYGHDGSAMIQWARVLERFLNGDLDGARQALHAAHAANSYFELLFTRKVPWPDETPDVSSPGSIAEASFCFRYLNRALLKHRNALSWLLAQSAGG